MVIIPILSVVRLVAKVCTFCPMSAWLQFLRPLGHYQSSAWQLSYQKQKEGERKLAEGRLLKSQPREGKKRVKTEKNGIDFLSWSLIKCFLLHKEQEFNCCQTKLKLWNRPFFFLHSNNFSCQFQIARAFFKIIIYKEVNSDRRWVSILKVVGHL